MKLHQTHIGLGMTFILVFLGTGVYMLSGFPELYQGREEVRMMYRATHIYILFAALVNLLVGQTIGAREHRSKYIQWLASALLFAAPFMLTTAFFIEPSGYVIERPISFFAVIFLFAGSLLTSLLNVPVIRRVLD